MQNYTYDLCKLLLCRAMCRLNKIINELGWIVSEHDHIFS